MMNCDQIKALLEAYALDALDDAERRQVEHHLAECADCRSRAADYAEVASRLPQALSAAAPLRPPAALKSRLLASLEAGSSSAASDRAVPPAPQRSAGDPHRDTVRSTGSPGQPRARRYLRTISLLAAIVLLALSLAWSARLSLALAEERALRAELAQLVGRQEIVLEVVDADTTVRRVLRPPAGDSASYGKLFTRTDLPYVVAMAARLPQPPEGMAYHLWLTRQGETRLAGTLHVNEDGFGLLVLEADQDGPTYDSALITLQPEGSTSLTGEPILTWENPD